VAEDDAPEPTAAPEADELGRRRRAGTAVQHGSGSTAGCGGSERYGERGDEHGSRRRPERPTPTHGSPS
jgi:hypothetical protein